MEKTAIIPGDMQTYHDDWKMSPGLACGDFVFLTGFTGADPSGHMASDPEAQMRNNGFLGLYLKMKEDMIAIATLTEITIIGARVGSILDPDWAKTITMYCPITLVPDLEKEF